MSPTIRTSDEVYNGLKKLAEPFVDTPDTVIARLLGLAEGSEPMEDETGDEFEEADARRPQVARPAARRIKKRVKRTRVPAGELLPESEYEMPILQALIEAGGEASSRHVVDRVGELLEGKLTDLDYDNLQSGGIRWQSRLQFVRLKLIKQGWMDKDAPRGTWAISDLGRKHFENETEAN